MLLVKYKNVIKYWWRPSISLTIHITYLYINFKIERIRQWLIKFFLAAVYDTKSSWFMFNLDSFQSWTQTCCFNLLVNTFNKSCRLSYFVFYLFSTLICLSWAPTGAPIDAVRNLENSIHFWCFIFPLQCVPKNRSC